MGVEADKGRILVVEPDERNRVAMSDLLREAGYQPVAVAAGEEALEATRRLRPGVAILEICLPGICGYEVCRRLREEHADSVSIVFVSGTRTEPYDRVAGLLLGADDYLCKPIAADELLARVERLARHAATDIRARLTRRECEVLWLLEHGLTHKEIAARLCISDKTVGTHVEHIFCKLGVHNRLQAVALTQRRSSRDRWRDSREQREAAEPVR
jgi:DNA-binding NarL/FixJ family response regulator